MVPLNKPVAEFVLPFRAASAAYFTPWRASKLSSQLCNMDLRDLISDVFRTLWSHKLRTFLTMFGIAWGIVSIVLMVAAGEGLRKGQGTGANTCDSSNPCWRFGYAATIPCC